MMGAVAISGLSAMALKRVGMEMQWLQVAASGAAGGVVGNLVLKAAMALVLKLGWAKKALDRFVAYLIAGFFQSLILGGLVIVLQFKGQHGTIGPALFVVVGWMVGLLASCLPLAILELNADETKDQKSDRSPGAHSD
jgi:hypothetical protein